MLIDTIEIEDFQEIIKDAGLNLADFELREQRVYLPKPEQGADVGQVIVRNRRTSAERSYAYRQWVLDFNDDLRNGVFD